MPRRIDLRPGMNCGKYSQFRQLWLEGKTFRCIAAFWLRQKARIASFIEIRLDRFRLGLKSVFKKVIGVGDTFLIDGVCSGGV